MTLKTGDLIDSKYVILDSIGGGGMGTVYRVDFGGLILALKVCNDTDDESKRRFEREVRIMRSLASEHVIEVLDANFTSVPMYFTMPLCQYSLGHLIPTLMYDHDTGIKIMIAACEGIQFIHEAGSIHRDIKPANILIDFGGKVKVSDLGLAKFQLRDSTILTESSVSMGTPDFMPPEYFESGGTRDAGVTGDIYQIGKTIYMVLTNKRPAHIDKGSLPGGLYFIVKTATAHLQEDRYQTVTELKQALERYLVSTDPALNPKTKLEAVLNLVKKPASKPVLEYFKEIIPLLYDYRDQLNTFYQIFHSIPINYLQRLAALNQELFNEIIDLYAEVVNNYLDDKSFSYEETDNVAQLLEAIFSSTADYHARNQIMYIAMMAAGKKNRYNAMDAVDRMLDQVKEDQEANAIAEMFYKNKAWSLPVLQKHPDKRRHYLIQKVIDTLQEENRSNQTDEEVKPPFRFRDHL